MNIPTGSKNGKSVTVIAEGQPDIRLDEVSVHFQHVRDRPKSLKEYTIRRVRRQFSARIIKALDHVSFQVNEGEVFGIIGRNGAGKSTLLQVMAGIIRPTHGRVRVWGQTTPLLGLGAGFNPELSGRENVHLYSSVLGRHQAETDELFDEIVRFAELTDFIDSPLRTYSTGMVARLGFAVAMAKPPKILLIDEVLGVGDEQFREKCEARFHSFQQAGATIVIVTHSMQTLEDMCTRAGWLEEGRLMHIGDPKEVVAAFRAFRARRRQTIRIREAHSEESHPGR